MSIPIQQKNIHWINYAKAFCMIAIYYTHAESFFVYSIPGLSKYMLPFYVNAFFFISGYLFFRKWIPLLEEGKLAIKSEKMRFLKNLLFRMIIPSCLISAIEFLPSSLLQDRSLSVQSFISKVFLGGTYWFISALVVAELLVFLLTLTRIKNLTFYLLCAFILFFIGSIISSSEWKIIGAFTINPWYFEKGLLAVPFLTMGGIYWKYEKQIDRYSKWYTALFLFAIYVILEYACNHLIKIGIASGSINAAGVFVSTLSIMLLIYCCKSIHSENVVTHALENVGISSIGFYFVCGAIPKTIKAVLPHLLPKGTLAYFLVGFFGSFIFAYIAVELMNRFLPFVFDLRNGFYKYRQQAAEK